MDVDVGDLSRGTVALKLGKADRSTRLVDSQDLGTAAKGDLLRRG